MGRDVLLETKVMARRQQEVAKTGSAQAGNVPSSPADWQFWLLAATLPLCFFASRLGNDLWYDEAYTLIHFVGQPWYRIVTDYSAPNNHIFFSLLLRPVYLVSDQEVLLRLPGFVFAAGTLWFTFQIGKHFGGVLTTGSLATLWLGLTQMFLNYVMEIRGYGLSLFLTSFLGWLALRPLAEKRIERILARIATIGATAALIWTIPTNLLFAICIGCFVFFRMGLEGNRKTLLAMGSAGLLASWSDVFSIYPCLGSFARQRQVPRDGTWGPIYRCSRPFFGQHLLTGYRPSGCAR